MIRKSLVAIAAVAVALVTIFALPAFAHTPPTLSGTPKCVLENGTWKTSWVLSNSTQGNSTFTIVSQNPSGVLSPTSVPQGSAATGSTTSPGSDTSASLSVTGHFAGESNITVSKTVNLEGECKAPPVTSTPTPPTTETPPTTVEQPTGSPPASSPSQPGPAPAAPTPSAPRAAAPVVAVPNTTG